MTATAETALEAEIEAYVHDAREINGWEMTAYAVWVLEANLKGLRGEDADNTAGELYRRILRGEALASEVWLVFAAAIIGGGSAPEVAEWAATRRLKAEPAEILYGVAREFLKPFAGKRERPPVIDLAKHMARTPRGRFQ